MEAVEVAHEKTNSLEDAVPVGVFRVRAGWDTALCLEHPYHIDDGADGCGEYAFAPCEAAAPNQNLHLTKPTAAATVYTIGGGGDARAMTADQNWNARCTTGAKVVHCPEHRDDRTHGRRWSVAATSVATGSTNPTAFTVDGVVTVTVAADPQPEHSYGQTSPAHWTEAPAAAECGDYGGKFELVLRQTSGVGNNHYRAAGVSGNGGTCTCPDGQTYQVGSDDDLPYTCEELACHGGEAKGLAGACRQNGAGSYSTYAVDCLQPGAAASATPYATADQWMALNGGDPDGDTYSQLAELESYRKVDGTFEFKLVWPHREGPNSQQWRQSSNPVRQAHVAGYAEVDVNFRGKGWGGLARSSSANALLDGSPDEDGHFFAVGATQPWNKARDAA
jgi:hypothetical protein